MKKFITQLFFFIIILIFSPAFISFAQTSENSEIPELDPFNEILEALPEDAREELNDIDVSEITKLSFPKVLSALLEIIKAEILKPLRLFASLAGVILLCALAETLRDGSVSGLANAGNSIRPISGSAKAFELVGVLAGAGLICSSIAEVVIRATNTITAAGAFMLTFIPIMAGILAIMGGIASANLFNASVIGATQIFSQIIASALTPLTASILGISIAGSVIPELKTEKLADAVKTIVIWLLGFSATIFSGLLTIQSLITSSADSAGMKAAKFIISGGVPIIGGAVSDALGALNSSVHILKNTTGAFGIISLCVLCAPPLISLICFRLSLALASAFGDMFGVSRLTSLIKSAEKVVSVILAMTICFIVITVISIALMLRIGSAV